MALRSAWWWMQAPPPNSIQTQVVSNPQEPHKSWPRNQKAGGISFATLEKTMQLNPGQGCRVDYLTYSSLTQHAKHPTSADNTIQVTRPKWVFLETATTAKQLAHLLTQHRPNDVHSVLCIASFLESEAIQVLGYHMAIPPRFFNFPYVQISTGNTVEQYTFYSLQFMEKYKLGDKPFEASRSDTSPSYRFRCKAGDHHEHEWHVTCIRLIFSKGKQRFSGLVQVDPLDNAVSEGLKMLMTRDEEIPPGEAEKYAGLGQILSETIYIITFTWTVFLNEAEAHLQILSQKCVDEDLSPTEQLRYTRELHQLSPLWVQVRRRLVLTKDLAAHMIQHPFFSDIGGYNGRITIEGYLSKQIKTVYLHIVRCNELAEQTNVLISLIFNIATLQDTKAAVEESKAANAFAASIRRVTMLTFVYLPLTLASSIFGMNITQITGENTHTPLWVYFTVASALMVATFAGWYVWSRLLSRIERRKALLGIA